VIPAVEATGALAELGRTNVSVTVGVAESKDSDAVARTLLDRPGQRLYDGKRLGRNRVNGAQARDTTIGFKRERSLG
jgi:PleD family two-component response regulator